MEFSIRRTESFLCRLEKSCAQIMEFDPIYYTQLTTHSPSKYNWRKEVLNLHGHACIVRFVIIYFSSKYSITSHQWYDSYNYVHNSIMDRFNVEQGCVHVDIMIEQYDKYLSDLLEKHAQKKNIYMG